MPSHSSPAVLVTGASSGIGRSTALLLARRGFRVLAGVRRAADAAALRAGAPDSLDTLLFDVTDEPGLGRAAAEAARLLEDGGLAGLVNNAGIVVPGPLECLPLDGFRRQIAVNLTGVLAATQAFLPLLRAGAGRIVTIGSIAGRLAFPMQGAYAASKFGLEGLMDALRRELAPWRLPVVLVDPGPVETPIWAKALAEAERLRADPLGAPALERYRPLAQAVLARVAGSRSRAVQPERVARVVHRALTARRPRTRYFVGRGTRLTAWMARLLPDRALDGLVARHFRRRPDED